jgi:hypothetical protein
MRSKNKLWTDQENQRLKVLIASGASALRAAAAHKCSIIGVRAQARKLGTPFPTVREVRKRLAAYETPPR